MKVFNKDFPIKVKFKQAIFEDSFIEEGMVAYLTKVSINDEYSDPESIVYDLSFNQEPFMKHNEILLTECYYQNKYTGYDEDKKLYTAKKQVVLINVGQIIWMSLKDKLLKKLHSNTLR